MKEQFEKALEWAMSQNIRGCVTGSALLEYFEGSDIDIFCYDEKAFTELYYSMHHNPMFTILDKIEAWKAHKFVKSMSFNNNHHTGIQTIKFTYNTCIDVNIILKKSCNNIFAVLSSFDMDIISKGYDLSAKSYLDLTGDSTKTKIASYNKWNPVFHIDDEDPSVWSINRILRQLERTFKYHKRGYNTDPMVLKYIELIDKIQEFTNIFSSTEFKQKLEVSQANTLIIKQICELWLKTHEITDDQVILLKEKIKEI